MQTSGMCREVIESRPTCVEESLFKKLNTSIQETALSAFQAARFADIVVMVTTLTTIKSVPRIVRGPIVSPPIKYPKATATTGFT
jgi:hypothetical protein